MNIITHTPEKRMLEYLDDRLREMYLVTPVVAEISCTKIYSLILNNDRAVMLIDKPYPDRNVRMAYDALIYNSGREIRNVGAVVRKDGSTFFRSDARWGHVQQNQGRLKGYSKDDISKMMLLSPEEIYVLSLINDGSEGKLENRVQYYQPKSSHLTEGLATYTVKSVDPKQGGKMRLEHGKVVPQNYILAQEYDYDGSMQLVARLLIPTTPSQDEHVTVETSLTEYEYDLSA
jgi:hypothetical protein